MSGRATDFRLALRAAALAAGATLFACPVAAKPQAAAAADAKSPVEHIQRFYAWYLGELRAGRHPFENEAKLRNYLSSGYIAQLHRQALPDFDPVLALPEPESQWAKMTVSTGKPFYYQGPGAFDVYVIVTYHGFKDRGAYTKGGTNFISVIDRWSIGLNKSGAGWRIASIGIADD
jgi:hypothetical protein